MLPILVIALLVALSVMYAGFMPTVVMVILVAILIKLLKPLQRLIVILWQFIEFIIFAPYRYILGGHTGSYPNNPLVKLFQFDLTKIFKGF